MGSLVRVTVLTSQSIQENVFQTGKYAVDSHHLLVRTASIILSYYTYSTKNSLGCAMTIFFSFVLSLGATDKVRTRTYQWLRLVSRAAPIENIVPFISSPSRRCFIPTLIVWLHFSRLSRRKGLLQLIWCFFKSTATLREENKIN